MHVSAIKENVEQRLRNAHKRLARIRELYGEIDPDENKDLVLEFCSLVVQNALCKNIPSSDSFGIVTTGAKPCTVRTFY